MEGLWLRISLKHKMLGFITAVILMVFSMTVFSIGVLQVYLSDFSNILEDNYHNHEVLAALEWESAAFLEYVRKPIEETEQNYEKAVQNTKRKLRNLSVVYEEIGGERYALTQNIVTTYGSYQEQCIKVIQLGKESNKYITELYYSYTIRDYLQQYARNLIQLGLEQGNQTYHIKVQFYERVPMIVLCMLLVISAFATLMGALTITHILNPVVELAKASKAIADNDLSIPDIRVKNQDEIGELVRTFNKMKHAMAASITNLVEKNKIAVRLHEEEIQRVEAQKMLETMQRELLQKQINPHFLFNTLNMISSTAQLEEAKDTQDMIKRLGDLFRYNLRTNSEKVLIQKEFESIKDYLFIQEKRFGDRMTFSIDNQIHESSYYMPTFTLQPLVENAILHGLSKKEEGGRVHIRIWEEENSVVITVWDNGKGIGERELTKIKEDLHKKQLGNMKIGLHNIVSRIKILYPDAGFDIFSKKEKGTAIRIILPKDREG
jgi:sensor histidine kinase YesM